MTYKLMLRTLLVLSLLVTSSIGFATTIEAVKILEIIQRPNSTVIRFDRRFEDSCSDGGVWGIFTSDGSPQSQQMWSLLLTAATAGKRVTIKSSECSYHNRIGDVSVHF